MYTDKWFFKKIKEEELAHWKRKWTEPSKRQASTKFSSHQRRMRVNLHLEQPIGYEYWRLLNVHRQMIWKKKNPKKLARWKRKWAEPRPRQRQASSVNRVLMTSKSNESNGRLCGNAGFWLISSRFASWVAAVERERDDTIGMSKSPFIIRKMRTKLELPMRLQLGSCQLKAFN